VLVWEDVALTAYTRFRLFWGAVSAEAGYGGSTDSNLGPSAVEGAGIGLRRAQLVFSRTAPTGFGEDVAVMHFDFVNFTGGNPDDSWTTADFTTLETALNTWWTSIKSTCNNSLSTREYRWYRIGAGVTKPNPAVRVTSRVDQATGASNLLPPQVAISITRKTGLRKRWGRSYLPSINAGALNVDGHVTSAVCDTLATAENTLNTTAAAADFMPVVYSPTAARAYAVESVQVDNVFDVIRRRRFDSTTYRKRLP
jgi:hypothetical protein